MRVLYFRRRSLYASSMDPENQKDVPPINPVPPASTAVGVPVVTPVTPGSIDQAGSQPTNIPAPEPLPPVSLLRHSKLLIASVVAYALELLLLGVAYSTQDHDTASAVSTATLWVGMPAAILLGAGVVQITLEAADRNGGRISGMAKIGIVLCIASIVTSGLTLLPGIVLLLVGLNRPAAAGSLPMSSTKKTLLAIGVFIATGGIGLGIALFITFMTSARACQLTSSKCY